MRQKCFYQQHIVPCHVVLMLLAWSGDAANLRCRTKALIGCSIAGAVTLQLGGKHGVWGCWGAWWGKMLIWRAQSKCKLRARRYQRKALRAETNTYLEFQRIWRQYLASYPRRLLLYAMACCPCEQPTGVV